MARATLSDLIEIVRGYTQAGASDYTVGAATYWDADQIQTVLDRHRTDVRLEKLHAVETYTDGGTVEYKTYESARGNFERTDGGTAIFYIETGVGVNVGTALYTVDYQRGQIDFAADQGGTVYYLTGRSYDLSRAAADIWTQKAGHYATAVNFSTDNHRIDRGGIIANCLQMAAHYSRQAGTTSVTIGRSDMVPGGWTK